MFPKEWCSTSFSSEVGGALFKFGPCADEAKFRNIVERSFATLVIREGEFNMIVYDGGVLRGL